MREQDITQTLINKANLQLLESPSNHPVKIHIALGELAELDLASIQNYWNQLAKGTPAEHAHLYFRLIPAEVQCMACFSKYKPVDKKIHCPYCGSFGAKILTGEECTLESIETEHD